MSAGTTGAAMAVVRVGVACLITSPKNPRCVLLGTRKGSHGAGKLATPGGHLELGENWVDCAVREVAEETNLKLRDVQYVHVTNDANIGQNPLKHYITIFMTAVTDAPEDLINLEPHKCESWNWVEFSQLEEYGRSSRDVLFEPMIHFLEESDRHDFKGKYL